MQEKSLGWLNGALKNGYRLKKTYVAQREAFHHNKEWVLVEKITFLIIKMEKNTKIFLKSSFIRKIKFINKYITTRH